MNKLKQIFTKEWTWFFIMWICGAMMGLSVKIVPSEAEIKKRHDTQVSKCLNVAQKWCPTDEKREQRFDWCMKQWSK